MAPTINTGYLNSLKQRGSRLKQWLRKLRASASRVIAVIRAACRLPGSIPSSLSTGSGPDGSTSATPSTEQPYSSAERVRRLGTDLEDEPVSTPLRSVPTGLTLPPTARTTGILGLQDDCIELIVSDRHRPYGTAGNSADEVRVLVLLSRETPFLIPLREFQSNFTFMGCLHPAYQVWMATGKLPPGEKNKLIHKFNYDASSR